MIDRWQAQDVYWNSFGLPAYNEQTVPSSVPDGNGGMTPTKMPYITYEIVSGSLDGVMSVNASVWFRGTSWVDVCRQTDKMAAMADQQIKIVDGYVKFRKSPEYFAQPLTDPHDDKVRRMRLNVEVEFLTA